LRADGPASRRAFYPSGKRLARRPTQGTPGGESKPRGLSRSIPIEIHDVGEKKPFSGLKNRQPLIRTINHYMYPQERVNRISDLPDLARSARPSLEWLAI